MTGEARIRVALSLKEAGDYAAAMRLYQQAIAENPKSVDALVGMGELYATLHAWNEAKRNFEGALALAPRNANALIGMGQALIGQEQVQAALEYLNQAAAAGPATARLANSLGMAYDLLGRHEDAQVQYGRGLDRSSGDPALMNNLALSFALSKNYETAIRLLSSLVTADQSPEVSRQNLALVYGLSGDFASAERLLALTMSPDQVKTRLFYFRRLAAASPDDQTKALFLGLEPRIPLPTPHEKPEVTPAELAAAKSAAPIEAAPLKAAPKAPTPAKAPSVALEKSKRFSVQLGSFKSTALAADGWQQMQTTYGTALRNFTPALLEVNLGKRGVYYRLYLKEIVDFDAANGLCASLKASKGNCLVRQFPASGNDVGLP